MSATELYITRPNPTNAYTDSAKIYSSGGGYDCTDNDDKTNNNSHNNNNANQLTNPQNAKEQQSMSAPTEQAEGQTSSSAQQQQQQQPDLNREDARLLTFENEHWDVPFLNKGKLAQIGFYYIGPQDTVRCQFCLVEIGKWEQDDDCFTEHSRWSPNCPLLRRQHTDNVPIDAEALNQILPPITYDTCGITGGGVLIRPNAYAERSFTPNAENERSSTASSTSRRSSPEMVEDMGPPTAASPFRLQAAGQSSLVPAMDSHAAPPLLTPLQHLYSAPSTATVGHINPVTTPHLEIEANRFKTFKEWPINLKMKPTELCDAGFFYTGMGDRVQCFSCGGGLKNWEDEDVAWEQHALWYPNCEYLKLMKGQKYIDAVQTIHRRKQDQGESSDTEEESSAGTSMSSGSATSATSSPGEGGRRMMDAMPSSSHSSARIMESRRMARRRHGSGSHPEADLESPQAMLLAKSAKPSDTNESKLCKICFEAEFNTAFIPCGHVVACAKCASAVTTCPVCREPFDSVTRIYFS